METEIIKISRDFSPIPGPRYKDEGDNSGEEFRESILLPKLQEAIKNNKKIIIDLDGAAGYGVAFLEEVFGGLIREHNVAYIDILNHLDVKSNEEDFLKQDVIRYIQDAQQNKMSN